jgi:hypothetical protein
MKTKQVRKNPKNWKPSKMKETINWRQLYNESQAIRPEDTSVSTEVIHYFSSNKLSCNFKYHQRICRLVNIYKNDMIEQDLHRHAQRLSRFFRCCQTCAPKSYVRYFHFYKSRSSLVSFRRLIDGLIHIYQEIKIFLIFVYPGNSIVCV